MIEPKEPLLVHDGKEFWCVYPCDNAYVMCLNVKPGEDGIRHVTQEMVEALKGWWYTTAVAKVEKALAALKIPWDDVETTDEDIESGDLMRLSKKLALASHHIVKVNNLRIVASARHSAAKGALEQAVHQRAGRDQRYAKVEGRPPPIDVRLAMIIHSEKPLRNAKIDIIETEALLKALEYAWGSLDFHWRTTSRIISSRLREPID